MLLHVRINILVIPFVFMSNGIQGTTWHASPGIQKTTVGQTASLEWTLSEEIDTADFTAFMNIHKGSVDGDNNRILRYTGVGCDQFGNARLSCKIQGTKVGFSISSVQDADAGDYVCDVRTKNTQPNIRDIGTLYILKEPSSPTISGPQELVAGTDKVTITCSSSSNSLPAGVRNRVPLSYTWNSENLSSDQYTPNGDSVTIGNVTSENDGAIINCTAQEEGSPLKAQKDVTLNVLYPPEITTDPHTTLSADLHENLTYTVKISAKPFPDISRNNITFMPTNQTPDADLPDNVQINVIDNKPNEKTVQLDIVLVTLANYGTYRLTIQNVHGMTNVTFELQDAATTVTPAAITVTSPHYGNAETTRILTMETSESNTTEQPNFGGLSRVHIVIIVICSILLVIAIFAIVYFFCCRRKKPTTNPEPPQSNIENTYVTPGQNNKQLQGYRNPEYQDLQVSPNTGSGTGSSNNLPKVQSSNGGVRTVQSLY